MDEVRPLLRVSGWRLISTPGMSDGGNGSAPITTTRIAPLARNSMPDSVHYLSHLTFPVLTELVDPPARLRGVVPQPLCYSI